MYIYTYICTHILYTQVSLLAHGPPHGQAD